MRRKTESGFTLIELSIVLLIIGLIVGGVLVGRDLIKAAEIAQPWRRSNQYQTASNAFKLKYNCLAGDCSAATTYLSGTTNGDGNGRIGWVWTSAESILFWKDLALPDDSRLVHDRGTRGRVAADVNFPSTKMGGVMGTGYFGDFNAGGALGSGWLFPVAYGNAILFGKPLGDTFSNMPLIGVISGADAQRIDMKFDDSSPAYGRIITWQNQSGYSGGCSSTDVATTAQYVNTSSVVCSLFFVSLF